MAIKQTPIFYNKTDFRDLKEIYRLQDMDLNMQIGNQATLNPDKKQNEFSPKIYGESPDSRKNLPMQ